MNKHLKYKKIFNDMKDDIISSLSDLDDGWAMRKWEIQEETSISMNILTVLLKELKHDGKIRIMMIWNEETGLPNGSGYCINNIT